MSVEPLVDRPRLELTEAELAKVEEYEFQYGPMLLLSQAVKLGLPVVVLCRNNHKLVGRVKAFDRHCNMILENVKELWTEVERNEKGKKVREADRERFVLKMFLRGDLVIIVVKA